MDAFRWDLAGRSHTPTLDSLARVGTYAEIYPVYPSNTFPSHYTMATGLHPDHHGVVNNGFYDRTQGRRLSVFDSLDVRTPGFWGGEPIWNTAERQGLTANIFMWPGSEVPIGGRQATVWTRYSSKPDYYQRADWVIDAMTRPEAEIPQLVMWYFEEPDAAMHTYGPESPEAVGRAEHIDSVLRYFFREIRRSPVFDRINFIVTADHGMAELSPDRYINLLPLLDTAQVVRVVPGTPFGLEVKEEYADQAVRTLRRTGHMKAWRRRADAPPVPLRHPPHPPDERHRHSRNGLDARLRPAGASRTQARHARLQQPRPGYAHGILRLRPRLPQGLPTAIVPEPEYVSYPLPAAGHRTGPQRRGVARHKTHVQRKLEIIFLYL